jgi:hypothetical protein
VSQELIYGSDRQLRDGERVFARLEDQGVWGVIAVDGGHYEIVRRGRHAWHFRLVDLETGEDTCEYVPYRVGRGGRILGGRAPVTLRGVALRPRRWTFASEAGWRVEAKVVDPRPSVDPQLFPLRVVVKLLRAPGDIWRAVSRRRGDRSIPAEFEVESMRWRSPVEVRFDESNRWLSPFEVRLEGVDSVVLSPDLSMLLAFGCWIVIEWRSMLLTGGGG